MRNRMLLWAAAVAGVALASGPASAQVVYQFASNTTPFGALTSASIPVAGSVTIRVYLAETPTTAPTLNAGGGMLGGAVRVVSSNPAVSLPVGAPALAATGGPWAFGNTQNNPDPPAAPTFTPANSAVINPFNFGPPLGTPVPAGADGRILLGTFTLTGLTGGTTTLTMRDPNSNAVGDVGNAAGTSLDPVTAGNTFALTVTAVPEPSSLLLGGLAMTGLAALRRRRKAAAVETTTAV